MSESQHPSSETIARGHENSAIEPRYFVVAVIGFAIFAVVLSLLLLAAMNEFAKQETRAEPAHRSPLAQSAGATPPQPWLQPSIAQGDEPRQPWQDMAAFREHENQILNSYGPVDSSTGSVRIPVDRAMQLLAERGVPTSQPAGGGK